MSTLPITLEYPLKRNLKYGVSINRFLDGSQQNFKTAEALNDFAISLTKLSGSQRDAYINAFLSAKGRYDNTLSLTVGTTTYTDLSFDSDSASSIEQSPLLRDATFNLTQNDSQARNLNSSPPTVWSAYPVLTSPFQLPYKPSYNFATSLSQLECGPSYAYSYLNASIPIYYLTYPSISDFDLNTLEQFYNYQDGPVGMFSFTDPDPGGATHAKCHFLNPSLEITYNEPNSSSVAVVIEVTNN